MSPASSAAINRFTTSTFSCDIAHAVLNTFPKAELLRESGNAVG
jgi:hypothetical protein